MHDLLAATARRLTEAGARDELLVERVRRRVLGIPLAPRLVPVERVWRLGVLLLGRSGTLYATGVTLQVREPRHPNAQSLLAEDRRELRALAIASGIAPGETINLDAAELRLDDLNAASRPVAGTDEGLFVAWSPTSTELTPLEPYLSERAELLAEPPEGA
jgi:hypothetical protein